MSGFYAKIQAYEHELILEALKATNGNRQRAADLLGLCRPTLLQKMNKLGIKYPYETVEDLQKAERTRKKTAS